MSLEGWLAIAALAFLVGAGWILKRDHDRADEAAEKRTQGNWEAEQARAIEAAPPPPAPQRTAEQELEIARAVAHSFAAQTAEAFTVRLGEPEVYREGTRFLWEGAGIQIMGDEDDPLSRMAETVEGVKIGPLPQRGKLIDALKAGKIMYSANVHRLSEAGVVTLLVKVITADQAKVLGFAPDAEEPAPVPQTYSIPLVGEQHYQAAVRQLAEGDALVIVHEPDNPYDGQALAVRTLGDATIGYLTRDCFVRELVHDEGKGCRATVEAIEDDQRGEGFLHVTIAAEKCAEPVEQRRYRAA